MCISLWSGCCAGLVHNNLWNGSCFGVTHNPSEKRFATIAWNALICHSRSCLSAIISVGVGHWGQVHIFLLGIEWNVLFCTEKSILLTTTLMGINKGVEVEIKKVFIISELHEMLRAREKGMLHGCSMEPLLRSGLHWSCTHSLLKWR